MLRPPCSAENVVLPPCTTAVRLEGGGATAGARPELGATTAKQGGWERSSAEQWGGASTPALARPLLLHPYFGAHSVMESQELDASAEILLITKPLKNKRRLEKDPKTGTTDTRN